MAEAKQSRGAGVLLPAVTASLLVHAGLITWMQDIHTTLAGPKSAVAMSLREPPPPPPKVEKPTVLPIAVDPPEKKRRPIVKEKQEPVEEKPKPDPSPPDPKAETAPSEEAARSPTPGPKDEVNGQGPAAGNGPMLGEGVNTTEGRPVRGEAGSGSPEGKEGGSAQAKSDLQGYHRNIYKAVRSAQRYPAAARRMGLEGRAVIAVRIDRSGHIVGKPRVVESTKHDLLDDEALRMVESAGPYPPLPKSYDKPDAEFMIPIKFYLSG